MVYEAIGQSRDSLGRTANVEDEIEAGRRIARNEVKLAASDGRTLIVTNQQSVCDFCSYLCEARLRPGNKSHADQSDSHFRAGHCRRPQGPCPQLEGTHFAGKSQSRPGEVRFARHRNVAALPRNLSGKTTGVDLLHVPYKGAASAMPDLVGRQIPIMIDGPSAMDKLQHAEKIRFLASTGPRRSPRRRLSGGPVAASQHSTNGCGQRR